MPFYHKQWVVIPSRRWHDPQDTLLALTAIALLAFAVVAGLMKNHRISAGKTLDMVTTRR